MKKTTLLLALFPVVCASAQTLVSSPANAAQPNPGTIFSGLTNAVGVSEHLLTNRISFGNSVQANLQAGALSLSLFNLEANIEQSLPLIEALTAAVDAGALQPTPNLIPGTVGLNPQALDLLMTLQNDLQQILPVLQQFNGVVSNTTGTNLPPTGSSTGFPILSNIHPPALTNSFPPLTNFPGIGPSMP